MAQKPANRNANPLPLIVILGVIVVFAFLLLTRGSDGQQDPTSALAVATTTASTTNTAVSGTAVVPETTAVAGVTAVASVAVPPSPTVTPTPAANSPNAPTTGRWIDVDVTKFQVQLMEGNTVLKTIGPVAVGAQIDTGAYESTQTGLFHVLIKNAALTYDAPYKTYISHWVEFDAKRANGFHSFLKDANGNIVDASTGRVSNGCIRTGDYEDIYNFAEIGMPVLIHT